MRAVTKHIGSSHSAINKRLHPATCFQKILVCRPNHRLGNLLLVTPIIQELVEAYPSSEIDLFVKGSIAPEIFKNYSNIHKIIELPKKPAKALIQYVNAWLSISRTSYDLVINVDRNSASGRLATKFANGRYKIFGAPPEQSEPDLQAQHIAKYAVFEFRKFLSRLNSEISSRQVPPLNLKLSKEEEQIGLKKLAKLIDHNRQTICLFTHATGEKCYSESWWKSFYKRLKFEFPDFNIIEILPIENISRLSFAAPTFYSKDIREIGSLIANTRAFIGADSGMMHLANAVQTPTIGLFCVTSEKLYGPYGNHSTGLNTCRCSTEDCIKILHDTLALTSAQEHSNEKRNLAC